MRKFAVFGFLLLPLLMAQAADSAPASPNAAPPASPVSTFSAATVSDFLVACKSDQGGCVAEVGNAVLDEMSFDGSPNPCISSPDYATPVPDWLRAHPQTAKMAPEDGIMVALKALYPCG